jgi:four helix bundle protein
MTEPARRRVDSFKDLIMWQKAMDLAAVVHELAARFPKSEIYGLAIQLRRAAVSVPSNIAEGQQRYGDREFIHFLSITLGSLAETETQLLLAVRFQYLTEKDVESAMQLIDECQRMVHSMRNRIIGGQSRHGPG